MNKTNAIIILATMAALYAAPALVYPYLPPEFFDLFGSLNGFRMVAFAYLFGLFTADVVAKSFQVEAEPKPEKKLHLKKREEPDDKLAEMAAIFKAKAEPAPPPKAEEAPPIQFDLDREYKLAMIKLANGNGIPPKQEPPTPPTYEELLREYNERKKGASA